MAKKKPPKSASDYVQRLFEDEYVAGKRPNTRENFAATLDLFERLCNPRTLKAVTERTLSAADQIPVVAGQQVLVTVTLTFG